VPAIAIFRAADEIPLQVQPKDLGLGHCEDTLNQHRELIRKFKAVNGKNIRSIGKRLQWPFSKDEEKELLSRLGRHTATYKLVLEADTL